MQVKVVCSHCKKEFEAEISIRNTEKNDFGFEKGSKGDFISSLIMDTQNKKGMTKDDLMAACHAKNEEWGYSAGRVDNVVSKLRSAGLITTSPYKSMA